MKSVFDEKNLKKSLKNKIKLIKKINVEKATSTLYSRLEESYTLVDPEDNDNTIIIKAEKKKNVPDIIASVIDEIKDIINIDDNQIVSMIFKINNYNNMVYIEPKY